MAIAHFVLSRAAHVGVLFGEPVDHGDQVEADQTHAQHSPSFLGRDGEVGEGVVGGEKNEINWQRQRGGQGGRQGGEEGGNSYDTLSEP